MKKSQRILPIKRLADNHEKKAAQQLGSLQSQVNDEIKRLDELQLYKQDYENKLASQAKSGISVAQFQHYQGFISRLEVAIKQQHNRIRQVKELCQQAKISWQETHNRSQALEKGIEKFNQAEQYQQRKKAQKESEDNYSARFKSPLK